MGNNDNNNNDLCQLLTVKIGELIGQVQGITSRISSLEDSDKKQFQLITVLVAVTLGLNNPISKSLLPDLIPQTNANICETREAVVSE